MNPGLAFDRHRLVMPGQVRAGIPRTGSGVPIATEKKTSLFIGSVVGLQECLDPLPQLGIAHAFFAIQDCGAFHGVIVVGSLQENGLHALRFKRHADNWCLRIIGVSSEWHSVKLNTLGFKVLRRKTPAHRLIINNMISISLDPKPRVSEVYSTFYIRTSGDPC